MMGFGKRNDVSVGISFPITHPFRLDDEAVWRTGNKRLTSMLCAASLLIRLRSRCVFRRVGS